VNIYASVVAPPIPVTGGLFGGLTTTMFFRPRQNCHRVQRSSAPLQAELASRPKPSSTQVAADEKNAQDRRRKEKRRSLLKELEPALAATTPPVRIEPEEENAENLI
jgi:hypothetical protein